MARGGRGRRTAAGGTQNRGGGGGGLATRGGALARGGTSGLKRTSNDPYRGSGAARTGAARSGGARTASGGGGVSSRRANAIRNLAQRGATPGERAAARAAAQRLGL